MLPLYGMKPLFRTLRNTDLMVSFRNCPSKWPHLVNQGRLLQKDGFCWRNRFLLTVICCSMSLATDNQWYIGQQISSLQDSISILTHMKQRKGNCIVQIFQFFRHYMKRNPAKTFDCFSGIYMYFMSLFSFSREKTKLHRLHVAYGNESWRQHTNQSDVTLVRAVICCRINHCSFPLHL